MLGGLAKQVREVIDKIPHVKDVRDDYTEGTPSIQVVIDRQKAALFGLTTDMIGFALKTAYNGLDVSTYRESNDDYDITSLGGAILGMAVFKLPFGIIMTSVGVISLAGVVVNNAIVLVVPSLYVFLVDLSVMRKHALSRIRQLAGRLPILFDSSEKS